MIKKIISIFLITLTAISLAACGSNWKQEFLERYKAVGIDDRYSRITPDIEAWTADNFLSLDIEIILNKYGLAPNDRVHWYVHGLTGDTPVESAYEEAKGGEYYKHEVAVDNGTHAKKGKNNIFYRIEDYGVDEYWFQWENYVIYVEFYPEDCTDIDGLVNELGSYDFTKITSKF